jgi:hypothetical protein
MIRGIQRKAENGKRKTASIRWIYKKAERRHGHDNNKENL